MSTPHPASPLSLHNVPPPTPDALRAARLAAGHSQAQAAAAVGMSAASAWARCEQENASSRGLSIYAWALYLLETGQHPGAVMLPRENT